MAFTHTLKVFNGPKRDPKKTWFFTDIATIENTDTAIAKVANCKYKNYVVHKRADKWR